MSLSDSMNFVAKSPASSHRTYRVQVAPLSGTTASPSDKISFDVPTGNGRRNVFLDSSESFVQFTFKNTSTAAGAEDITIDSTAYSVIDSLTTLAGGNVLEQISDYGALVNALIDANMNNQDVMCAGSLYMGASFQSASNVDRTGRVVAKGGVIDCALPLVGSAIFSGAATRMIPVGAMADLRCEISLASLASGAVGTASATLGWRLENVLLNLTYTEIDSAMADQIHNSVGGVYRVSTEGYRVYSTISQASRTADSITVPARFSSVKSIGCFWRRSADVTAQAAYSQSNRANPLYSATGVKCSWQAQVGSALIPQQPLTTQSELYQALQQSFHNLGSTHQGTRISATNWVTTASTTDGNLMGTAIVCVNTDQIIGKNATMTSGFSTLSSPVLLSVVYPVDPAVAHKINSFVAHDAVLEVSAGGTFMRY